MRKDTSSVMFSVKCIGQIHMTAEKTAVAAMRPSKSIIKSATKKQGVRAGHLYL